MEEKPRVRPIKIRGVKVSGLFIPFSTLEKVPELKGISELRIGVSGNTYKGYQICKKYELPKRNVSGSSKDRSGIVPEFTRHVDTEHYYKSSFRGEGLVYITEKLHGTSCRAGWTKVVEKLGFKDRLRILLTTGEWVKKREVQKFTIGTRRVVKYVGDTAKTATDYYGNPAYQDVYWKEGKKFEELLEHGETVYFEIVGYNPDGNPIMPSVSNKKLSKFLGKQDYKKFIETYGETTNFNYGAPSSESYVYRITRTGQDGKQYDLSHAQLLNRCRKMGVKAVPTLDVGYVNFPEDKEALDKRVEFLTNSESVEFPMSVREGVIVRYENGKPTPQLAKHKSFIFKVLEDIIKDDKASNEYTSTGSTDGVHRETN